MIKHEGKGNFGVRVENKNDPNDVTIHWCEHPASQNDVWGGYNRMRDYRATKVSRKK